jgi:hypothetical protein
MNNREGDKRTSRRVKRAISLLLLMAVILPTHVAMSQSGCPSQMSHYWKLDETGGPPYLDFYGSNDATCTVDSCPSPVTGQVNGALEFDFAQQVRVADDGTFDWSASSSFTIELWMQKSTPCEGGSNAYNNIMVGRYDGSGGGDLNLWWLGTNCDPGYTQGGIRFVLREDVSNGISIISGTDVVDGDWHHVVAVWNAADSKAYLYIDGVLEVDSAFTYSTSFASAEPMTIGYLPFAGYFHYDGLLDEIALYDRALPLSEIENHYDRGLLQHLGYCQESAQIVSDPVTDALVDQLYSYDVDAIGEPPLSYSLPDSPTGMAINENTGLIEWTPTDTSDASVTVQATNTHGSDEQTFDITVRQVPEITSSPVTEILVSQAYSYDVEASGDPAPTFSLTNAPEGMTIDENSGLIEWSPDDSADASVTVVATNEAGADNQTFTITVGQIPELTSSPVTDALVGELYTYNVEAVGDPAPEFALLDAPTGMTIDENSGQIEWTPSDSADASVTVEVANAHGSDQQIFSITVLQYVEIFSSPVSVVLEGNPYYYDVLAVGDPPPVYSLIENPVGMIINSTTGEIDWTDPVAGYYDVTVEAENTLGTDIQEYTLAVADGLPCPIDMAHYYLLDETTSGDYLDLVGGSNAYCIGCPAPFSAGKIGGAQDFDGVADGLLIPDDGTFDWGAEESFTIEIWLKTTTTCSGDPADNDMALVARMGDDYGLNSWRVAVKCSGIDESGTVYFLLEDAYVYSTTKVNGGVWHHVAAVRDAATDEIIIYVDGEPEGLAQLIDADGFGGTRPITVGYFNHPSGGQEDKFRYNGLLDELVIHNRALSPTEIAAHYALGMAEPTALSICDGPATAPEITSDPVTKVVTDHAYSYQVVAGGNPTPTFALVDYPTGMTIDPLTGVIEWLPLATGEESVTVEASNSVGTDIQEFTVLVTDCPDGMLHFWKLDEETGPDYLNFAGMTDASCVGSCPTAVPGVIGMAQEFSGQQIDVPYDGSCDWPVDASFSFEFWVKKESLCGGNHNDFNNIVVGRKGSGAGNLGALWIGVNCLNEPDHGKVRFVLKESGGNGPVLYGNESIVDGDWHHVVAVRDGSLGGGDGMNRLYVDGELQDSAQAQYLLGFEDTVPLNVGYYNQGGFYYLDGTVDEMAIYDRALTDSEVAAHYLKVPHGYGYCDEDVLPPMITSSPELSATVDEVYEYQVEAAGQPDPVFHLQFQPAGMQIDSLSGLITWTPSETGDFGVIVDAVNSIAADTQGFTLTVTEQQLCPDDLIHYWLLEEAQGPYQDMVTGQSNAACMTQCPTSEAGRVGSGLAFDSNWVFVADDGSFDWTADDAFTFEFWFKHCGSCRGGSNSFNEMVISRYDAAANDDLNLWWVGMNCDPSCTQEGIRFVLREDATEGFQIISSEPVNDCEWHHVAAMWNGENDSAYLYIDGDLDSARSYQFTTTFVSDDEINIGWIDFVDNFELFGSVDELAVYSRALTPEEVEGHYNSGLAGLGYCYFTCGDVDVNGTVNVSDVVYLISFVFGTGGPPRPLAAGDVDCNGSVNVSDVVYLIEFVFGDGPEPCAACP